MGCSPVNQPDSSKKLANIKQEETKKDSVKSIIPNFAKTEDIKLFYDFGKDLLGSGSYGKVYKGIYKKTNEYRAIKEIPKTISDVQTIINEAIFLHKLVIICLT